MSPNEKHHYNNLSYGNVQPFDSLHPNYHITFLLVVCKNVLTFAPMLSLSLLSSISHTSSSHSLRQVALFPFLSFKHKSTQHFVLFINCLNKVIWLTSRFSTYDRLITISAWPLVSGSRFWWGLFRALPVVCGCWTGWRASPGGRWRRGQFPRQQLAFPARMAQLF